jgi:hypothetical protein
MPGQRPHPTSWPSFASRRSRRRDAARRRMLIAGSRCVYRTQLRILDSWRATRHHTARHRWPSWRRVWPSICSPGNGMSAVPGGPTAGSRHPAEKRPRRSWSNGRQQAAATPDFPPGTGVTTGIPAAEKRTVLAEEARSLTILPDNNPLSGQSGLLGSVLSDRWSGGSPRRRTVR